MLYPQKEDTQHIQQGSNCFYLCFILGQKGYIGISKHDIRRGLFETAKMLFSWTGGTGWTLTFTESKNRTYLSLIFVFTKVPSNMFFKLQHLFCEMQKAHQPSFLVAIKLLQEFHVFQVVLFLIFFVHQDQSILNTF